MLRKRSLITAVPVLLGLLLCGCLDNTTAWLSDGTHIAHISGGVIRITNLDGHTIQIPRIKDAYAVEVEAAPSGGLFAVLLEKHTPNLWDKGEPVFAVFDHEGKMLWKRYYPKQKGSLGLNCWSPDGNTVVLFLEGKALLVQPRKGTIREIRDGEKARVGVFGDDGTMMAIRKREEGYFLEKYDTRGNVVASEQWIPPNTAARGLDDAFLSRDGMTAWAPTPENGWIRFGKDGATLFFTSDEPLTYPGHKYMLLQSAGSGYYILNLSDYSATCLNLAYNRMLVPALAAHLENPQLREKEFGRESLLLMASFSPDDTKLALTYGNALYVWDLKTQEVRMLVSW